MCADLAAFVAHKQAHCGAAAGPVSRADPTVLAALGGSGGDAAARVDGSGEAGGHCSSEEADGICSPASSGSSGACEEGGSGDEGRTSDAGDGSVSAWLHAVASSRGASAASGAPPAAWRRVPQVLRTKLLLLACMSRVAALHGAHRRAPPLSPVNLLVSELLVPEESMRDLCEDAARAKGGAGEAREGGAAVAAGVAALRRLSVRVVAEFGRLAAARGGGGGGGGDDDMSAADARPKQHDDVVHQLRQRLMRLVGQDRDAMRGGWTVDLQP